ncbi:MAG: hypothetical protein HRT74_13055 [Flavobacteriales bacterium]|nr:hypothetical protein [Flavobacteriales bacterium]
MRLCFIISLLTICSSIHAQDVQYHRVVRDSSSLDGMGPNGTWAVEGAAGYGHFNAVQEDLITWRSHFWQAHFSTWYKTKARSRWAFSWGYGFTNWIFDMNRVDESAFNTFGETRRDRFKWSNVGLTAATRYNIGQMGLERGLFVELGIEQIYAVRVVREIRLEEPAFANSGSGTSEVVQRRLKYVRNWQTEANGAIGYKNFCLIFGYRITDLWEPAEEVNDGDAFPELPRWRLGIRLYADY